MKMMESKFYTKVNLQKRKGMEEYLRNHPRYYTMNPWNKETSFAHNVKLYRLGLDDEQVDKLYEMINVPEFYYGINEYFADFEERTGYAMAFNGRSGGYIVLYDRTNPTGHGIEGDMSSWSISELRTVARIVQDFDRTIEDIRKYVIYIVDNYVAEEIEVMVPQKRMELKWVGAA